MSSQEVAELVQVEQYEEIQRLQQGQLLSVPAESELESDSDSDSDSDSNSNSMPELESDSDSDSIPEFESDSDSDSIPELESDSEPGDEPEPKPDDDPYVEDVLLSEYDKVINCVSEIQKEFLKLKSDVSFAQRERALYYKLNDRLKDKNKRLNTQIKEKNATALFFQAEVEKAREQLEKVKLELDKSVISYETIEKELKDVRSKLEEDDDRRSTKTELEEKLCLLRKSIDDKNNIISCFNMCKICMEPSKKITHVILPCGHFVCCSNCLSEAERIRQHKKKKKTKCPLCRKKISSTVRVYMS